MKCPKCDFDNPDDTIYCGKCATPLPSSEEAYAPPTETLETPKEELTTGSTFAGRYQIIEELGKGGMGKVYKALDKEINAKIALKLIKPEIAADKKTIERFRNELKMARDIAHKNVCRMYDLNKEEGTYYLTMEYVSGEDLKSFIRRARQLTAGTVIVIAKQVCEGLAEAHRLGVVHRDLKPQNIMIDKEGNARIMDFGIARSLREKGITGAGVMIGTPEYMSPEQAEAKDVDKRSDIYSLGAILYEMVTGRVPFEGETPLSIAMKHKGEIVKDPRELNAQIPEDLSRVILKCMEKHKEKRYQSAEDVHSELTKIEKGIPTAEKVVPKRKPTTAREMTVTLNLRKFLIPALAVAALVIAAVVIWQLLPKKEVVLGPKIENSIAVISFENQTGDDAFNYLQKAIPNLLITNLEQTGYLYVTTWERMEDLLEQMGKEDVELIDKDLGFEICRREGIAAIVLGSFIKMGDTFATDVKVLEVETKKLLKSASSKGKGLESILETQIDELSREISIGIGIAVKKIEEASLQIADVTTSSLDAYNYYLKGREDYEKMYFDDAKKSLEKAIQIDSTFALAYLDLALTYGGLGLIEAKEDFLKKAKTYSGKATEKDRLYIEASYASFIENDPEKGFLIRKRLAEKYPKEKRVHFDLAKYYKDRKKSYDKAIEEFSKALELDPKYGLAINELAFTYAAVGDYDKALEFIKRYVEISPGDAKPIDSMAGLYFRMGNLNEAIVKFKEAIEMQKDFFESYWKLAYIYALKEEYSETMRWIDKFLTVAKSPRERDHAYIWKGLYHAWLGDLDQSLASPHQISPFHFEIVQWLYGWIYYEWNKFELSRKAFLSWYNYVKERNPEHNTIFTSYYNFLIGLINLKQGDLDSTKLRLTEIKSPLPRISRQDKTSLILHHYHDFLFGEFLLAEGRVKEAISVCEEMLSYEVPELWADDVLYYCIPFLIDILARAYYQNGELDRAIAEYERLITFDPSSKEHRLIHPKYHYRLAKLYEEKGWKGKAIDHYEKFLYLWKDADPDIAEVEDARNRLAGLKGQ